MKFESDYCEELALPGGDEHLRLRLIRPQDKAKMQQALARLSPRTQYLRFFTTKSHFTARELSYLTELDGHDHFAIGAVLVDEDGREGQGVGVARFVRLPGEPRVAEPAVVVVDEMQRRGIGALLMRKLVEAAKERDVEVFRSEFLARNDPVRELLRGLSPHIHFEGHGTVVTAEFPLRPTTALVKPRREHVPDGPFDALVPLQAVLRLVAGQGIELRHRFRMLFDPERLVDAWRDLKRELTRKRDRRSQNQGSRV